MAAPDPLAGLARIDADHRQLMAPAAGSPLGRACQLIGRSSRRCVRRVRKRSARVLLVLAVACAPAPAPLTPVLVMDGDFVLIHPGTFQMGDVQSRSVHTVSLTHAFLMQKTEVTQAEWVAVTGSNPSYFNACGATCPVENVSYDNVRAFIARLNDRSPGKRYRLPTEAEWEYAARGRTDEELFPDAWTRETSGETTHPVGTRQPNAWGLSDMEGNVWEWVSDWHGPYPLDPVTDPIGPPASAYRLVRGGSWMNAPTEARATSRLPEPPTFRANFIGFRLARTP
jgi:formylglycine-generating enzyme required for sulfatase activity